MNFEQIAAGARAAAAQLASAGQREKNAALAAISAALRAQTDAILAANALDVAAAEENGIRPVMVDRLRLTAARISAVANGVDEVAALPDPTGEVLSMSANSACRLAWSASFLNRGRTSQWMLRRSV